MAPRRRHFQFEFRLCWRYKGETRERRYVSERPFYVLKLLRKIGTVEPWRGCTAGYLRQVWAIVAIRQGIPIEAAAEMTLKQACLAIQASYPKLEYIRVEMRQVGEWTPVLDPLRKLAPVSGERAEKRQAALIAHIEGMTREELDAWRWLPTDTQDRPLRRRVK